MGEGSLTAQELQGLADRHRQRMAEPGYRESLAYPPAITRIVERERRRQRMLLAALLAALLALSVVVGAGLGWLFTRVVWAG